MNEVENSDVEIWRETPGDYYSPSARLNAQGMLGIDVGGRVFVMSLRAWHELACRTIDALPSSKTGTRN